LAKEYSIPSATITVQINKDGSANVTEERRYSFDGSFSWADEWIPIDGHQIKDVSVRGATSFTATEESGKVYIKWYYQAYSEDKTFTVSYKITDAGMNGQKGWGV